MLTHFRHRASEFRKNSRRALFDVVRPSFASKRIDLKSREGARGVQDAYRPSTSGMECVVGYSNQSPSRAPRAATRVAKPVYMCARAAQNSDGRLAQRDPQGYAGSTTTRGALFSCFAAARAACVSTWLGECGGRPGGSCRYAALRQQDLLPITTRMRNVRHGKNLNLPFRSRSLTDDTRLPF